ncbi:hypothetical protein PIB30_064858 [Stylosanthes scabra]|uniref:Transposase (putative) gypsy type domain-containing protein n=1 Tax=Stylosanthes scabra TaxID=79078 RepID=A0ABU6VK45_9FABA|nr:hypothetical protein [Stylosanthes scabra]
MAGVGESEEGYEWVSEAVRGIASLFVDVESVRQLGSPLLWVRNGQDVKFEFLPCASGDRVCHEGKGADWFYMYTCVFAEIGIRFPFTEFECAVLRQLNCAPSQIHPNSWGFIRAFEVLMEYLREEPSLELFFFLFQAKGVDRGLWVTLSSHQGRTVFSLFKATYRDFKKFYVKVRSPGDAIPFFLDENLSQKFLLYWKRKPVQCLGVEELSERDAGVCGFISENLKGGKILTTSELLKWDSDRGVVVKYLETKVPDCSTAGLKSFFKQRAEKEVSTSHVVKVEHGSEVNKPLERKRQVSLKRMRSVEASGKKVIDLTEKKCCGKEVSLEYMVKFASGQRELHSFEGAEDCSSVWGEHFPFTAVADEHFRSKGDLDLLDRAGKVAVARYMQVQAARFMCITQELEVQALEEDGFQKKKMELEKRWKMAADQVDLKEKEIRFLKEESEDLKNKVTKLSKDKQDLEGRIVDLCVEKKEAEESKKQHGFQMFAVARDRAKAQAELLAPGVKFDKMDP